MTRDEALKIIRETDSPVFGNKNRILRGMNLLTQVDPSLDTNTDMAAERDIIFFGGFDTLVKQMTPEQVRQMAEWGWFESEESWAHHV